MCVGWGGSLFFETFQDQQCLSLPSYPRGTIPQKPFSLLTYGDAEKPKAFWSPSLCTGHIFYSLDI